MGAKVDLTGRRFGWLTVVSETDERRGHSVVWLCKCDCGTYKRISAQYLKSGRVLSCGCYNKTKELRHGMSHTRLHHAWQSMIDRCVNPNNKEYANYGGRGIKVCDKWMNNFEAFADWSFANEFDMTAPRDKCTLDRIDVNGNYEPSNCRWADMKTQCRNRRNNVVIECDGESHCLSEWAEILGEPYTKLASRHRRGWSPYEILYGRERAVPTETYRNRKTNRLLTYQGETHCAVEWAEILGMNVNTIRGRLHRGWSDERVLGTPT